MDDFQFFFNKFMYNEDSTNVTTRIRVTQFYFDINMQII